MTIRLSLAAMALLGAAAFVSPALAIEQVHIPDSTAADNSGPPDALFDKSIPTTWQQKQDPNQSSSGLSSFHFSAGSGSNPYSDEQRQYTTGFQGESAGTPGSEFHNNGVPLNPYYAPPQ
jgi:hypothetical protein